MTGKIDEKTYEALKRAYSWLDCDKDNKVSLNDLKEACGINDEAEALTLFESLSPTSNDFILFEDFCKGVLNFPLLLKQFKQEYSNSQETPLDYWVEGIRASISALNISVAKLKNPEEISDLLAAEINNYQSHKKRELGECCKGLFKLVRNLKETCEAMQGEITHKTLEFEINLENSLREKERIEEKYTNLLNQHYTLELDFAENQQQQRLLEHQLRESGLKLVYAEGQCKSTQKNIEEYKAVLIEKDKIIADLNKKVKINNSLNTLKEMHHKEQRNSAVSSTNVSLLSTPQAKLLKSITPRGKFLFDFEKIPEKDTLKDQVIKKLRENLQNSMQKYQNLEDTVSRLENANQSLVEKIKQINSPKFKYFDEENEENDYKFDTFESLRDEIVVLNSDFPISSRISVKPKVLCKEAAVQYEWKCSEVVETKRRGRFSCFSFFS